MIQKTIQAPLSLKSISETGEFTGYGSVFDVVDHHNDQIKPGAFAKSLKKHSDKGTLPALLWQHRHDKPIGKFTKMSEDQHGLYLEGKLLVNDDPLAKTAYAHLKNESVRGLSIGGRIVDEDRQKDGVYFLNEFDLWEVSVVTFAANPEAKIQQVKTIRELENTLRDVMGFSRKEAKRMASAAWPTVADRDDQAEVLDALKNVNKRIKHLT